MPGAHWYNDRLYSVRVKVKYGGALLVNPGDAICQHGDEVEEGETDGGVAAEDNGGRGKAE